MGLRTGWRLGKGRCRRRLPALARVGGSEPPSCLCCSTCCLAGEGLHLVRSARPVGCPGGVLVGPAASLVSVEARGGVKLNQCLGLNCLCNLSRRVQSESRLPGLRLPELRPDPGRGCRGSGWRGVSCAAFCLFRWIQTRGRPENRAALERFAGSLPVSRARTAAGVVLGLSLASWGNSVGFRGVEGLVVEWVDVGVRTSCASFHVGELAPGRLGAWCWRSGRTSRPGESPCLSGRLGSMA